MTSETARYQCDICGETFEKPAKFGGHKNGHRIKIERDELIAEVQRLFDETGRVPTSENMDREGRYSRATVKKRFGSWNAGLRAARLTPVHHHELSRDDIIQDIQGVAEELGHAPTVANMRSEGQYSVTVAQSKFGSWNDALVAAGYKPNKIKQIPRDDLLAEIRRLSDVLGHPPSTNDLKEHGKYSVRGYFREFDGWHEAVREAGFEPRGWPSGEENPRWRGGRDSQYYGPDWNRQRERAIQRDDWICQTPGCSTTRESHVERFGHDIHVHHIVPLASFERSCGSVDFQRANCLSNLVTVCTVHHIIWERISPLRPDTRHL
ncbi:HNH endonuclease [Halobacteria archaeon HArc-gm2]|nr:HNH endonuclease [Halobacteria archaeon HArc-gm2]